MVIKSALTLAAHEGEVFLRKQEAHKKLLLLASEIAEVVNEVADERGLDDTNLQHLGECPNPKQLVQDRKLHVSERMRLQAQGILLPPSLDEDNSVVIPNMPLGRSLPPKPAARWKQTKVTIQNKAKRADAEEQGRFNRKRRELARTPHPMLLTRISQLVASFEDLQRDMDTLHAMLDGDQNSSSRRKLARDKSSLGGRSIKRGQSIGARQPGGMATQPSGLLLSLDIASMPSDLGSGKMDQLASKSRQEALLQSLEQKKWLNMEELAVVLQFLSERLRMLPISMLKLLCPAVQLQQREQHSVVYNCGEDSTHLYLVLSGTFENLLLGPGEPYRPLIPKKLLAVYRKGACFGEPDLLHAQPHSSTVVCSGVGMLALVPRKQYLEILGTYLRREQGLMKSFLQLRVEALRSADDGALDHLVKHLESRELGKGFEVEVMQEKPPTVYFIRQGTVQIQALDHAAAPSIEDVQAYIRDPAAPTMADAGVLASVAIHEGGHAQGTLGQASRLRDLVRSMTPTKVLGEVSIGGVFGGGRLFVGEGEQQDSLKVVALAPLRVMAVPAEQLVLESPGNVVEELRNYMAFQMTYWLSRCNMISKHACVGHKSSDVCMQVARVARAQEERRKKERQRQAARVNAQKSTGRPMSVGRGERVAHCMKHVASLRDEFVRDIETAQIDLHGTPAEKFWAHPEAMSQHAAKSDRMLAAVFPQKLQPLCSRLEVLQARADRQARWHAQQQELEEVRKANEVTLGNFVANLDRPMSADEQHVFLRAHAGLDVPEGNPLNLLPMRAPAPPGPSTRSTSLSQARPRTCPGHRQRKAGDLTAACRMWQREQGVHTPAVRQMLTFAEIRRHRLERQAELQQASAAVLKKMEDVPPSPKARPHTSPHAPASAVPSYPDHIEFVHVQQ